MKPNRWNRVRAAGALLGIAVLIGTGIVGCATDSNEIAGRADGKTAALDRAERRLYDGAPPVIPHASFGASCTECHNERGMAVEGVGFAPPTPHKLTAGMSAISRCQQCHVFSETDELFVENDFAGLRQDLRHGDRLNPVAPPVIPHRVFMRENCQACHTGDAAREEIRTSHPERARCQQCHVPTMTQEEFARN